MVSVKDMQRGAREANEESRNAAQSRAMGEAIGSLAALVAVIHNLRDRIENLESTVRMLTNKIGDDR